MRVRSAELTAKDQDVLIAMDKEGATDQELTDEHDQIDKYLLMYYESKAKVEEKLAGQEGTSVYCQRAVVYKLLQVIDVALQFESGRNNPISPMLQLLIALSYYATGSFQIIEGDLCAVSSLDRQFVTT
ncbi:hypothetical protein M8J76_008377 [Diaphorina citri]|nr:hypothetical protein M8J76_008377 [Diaphorina citri]